MLELEWIVFFIVLQPIMYKPLTSKFDKHEYDINLKIGPYTSECDETLKPGDADILSHWPLGDEAGISKM